MPRNYGKKKAAPTIEVEDSQPIIAIVDFQKEMFRWLFQKLYEAVLNQAELMGDSESAVRAKFMELLAGNPAHVFIVELIGDSIRSHCLFRYQEDAIVIEQFCGTKEFITTVLQTLEENETAEKIVYAVDESNVDYFIDECNFSVAKVHIEKSIRREP